MAWNGIVQGGMMEWARGKVAADISFLNYRFTFLPVLPLPALADFRVCGGRGGGGGDVDSYTDYDALEHVHVRKGERQRARGRINDFLSPLSFIACGH